MSNKKIGILTSGGDCGGLNAAIRSIFYRAKNKYNMDVFGIKDGTAGLMQRPVAAVQLTHKTFEGYLLRQGGTFLGSTNKGNPFKFPTKDGKFIDTSKEIIEGYHQMKLDGLIIIGGDGSMQILKELAKEGDMKIVAIPKTIDNDLPFTDNCPGFGSVAKYIATSTKEAALDVKSMSKSSTKVFIFEVMGRHAGWLAAASGLAKNKQNSAPHIILLPEVPFNENKFLKRVKEVIKQEDYCVIVVSEGARYKNGEFLADAGTVDSFGHKQLGGVAPTVAEMVSKKLGLKYHWAVSDYLQRSARHISSQVDLDQAYAVGKAAVEYAAAGENSIMPIIVRKKAKPYSWEVGKIELSKVANVEKKMPKNFISKDGFGITAACKNCLSPLIQGEAWAPFEEGVIQTAHLKNKLVRKKLKNFKI